MNNYTLNEINDMRYLLIQIDSKLCFGENWCPNKLELSYLEQKLQTYIMGGVTLKELEQNLEDIKSKEDLERLSKSVGL